MFSFLCNIWIEFNSEEPSFYIALHICLSYQYHPSCWVRLEFLMIVAMKIVVFLDLQTESHLSMLKLKLLQQLAKINTGIQTFVTVTLSWYIPAAKNSLGFCWHHSTTLFCSLPSECTAFETAINDPETWTLHGNKCGLYARVGCLSISHHMPFIWSCTLCQGPHENGNYVAGFCQYLGRVNLKVDFIL